MTALPTLGNGIFSACLVIFNTTDRTGIIMPSARVYRPRLSKISTSAAKRSDTCSSRQADSEFGQISNQGTFLLKWTKTSRLPYVPRHRTYPKIQNFIWLLSLFWWSAKCNGFLCPRISFVPNDSSFRSFPHRPTQQRPRVRQIL